MSNTKTHAHGIYFNTSPDPVFLEGLTVGGHDYVYVEGFLRLPGHFLLIKDPKEDPTAPETFRIAYQKMMEKGDAAKQETHANSNRRVNVIDVAEESKPAPEPKKEEPKPKSARTRKGKSDSTSSTDGAQ